MLKKILFASTMLASAAAASGAFAQAAPATAPSDAVSEVVVTGSLVIRNVANAPTPVMAQTAEQLSVNAPQSVAIALSQSPVFANTTSSAAGGTTAVTGTYLNLRSLGATRTLTLLDGQRIVAIPEDNGNSSVNAEFLPTMLLRRVDTVTGGASAAYGSDAVSGVVNFVLNRKFTGLLFEAQKSLTTYGDNAAYKVGVAGGAGFADDRGHVLFSAEYAKQEGVLGNHGGVSSPRPWAQHQNQAVVNPVAGGPAFVVIPDVRLTTTPLGFVVLSGPLKGTGFNPDGTTYNYNFGTNVSGAFATGGDGYNPVSLLGAAVPQHHASFFGRVSYDLNSKVNAYIESEFGITGGQTISGTVYSTYWAPAGISIDINNPFVPASLRQSMVTAGVTKVAIGGTLGPMQGDGLTHRNDYHMERVVAGLDVDFGHSWRGNVYYQFGSVTQEKVFTGAPSAISLFYGTDAVRSPSGQIVCRITLTVPNSGCVPLNFFGNRQWTPEQIAYVFGSTENNAIQHQNVIEAKASGDLFSTWAGPIGAAIGAGYRSESLRRDANQLSSQINPFTGDVGGWVLFNQPAAAGEFHLWEGFGELNIPLLNDQLVRSASLNTAVRYTDYSTSGGVTTWKVGLTSELFSGFRLRLARSRDIRAPNIGEYFNPAIQSVGGAVQDPLNNNATTSNVTTVTSGDPNLDPERSDTTTYGVNYRPEWFPGLYASVDYFDIQIQGAISTLTAQQTVNGCAQGIAQLCANITRDPTTNGIRQVARNKVNLASLKTSGVDMELSYRHTLGWFGREGDVSLRWLSTYTDHYTTQLLNLEPLELAGQVTSGGIPHWRHLVSVGYSTGPLKIDVTERYVGGGVLDKTKPSLTTKYDGQFVTDLAVRYKITKSAEGFVTITNLFNTDPPILAGQGNGAGISNNLLYNYLGRNYTVGLKMSF